MSNSSPAEAAALPTVATVEPADFIAGKTKVSEIGVRISYAIIDRFSEGLYSSPNKAFEELVSNSYDAGAEKVWVHMPDDPSAEGAAVAVVDNGVSMDLKELEEFWEIGVSRKRSVPVNAGREPIGKFGIGKLATYVLARELTYICSRGDKYLAVTMDYGKVPEEPGQIIEPEKLALDVIELTRDEALESLKKILDDTSPAIKELEESEPGNWTAAILTALKPRGKSIEVGRLKWILRTALPVNPSFRLWFNANELKSAKLTGDRDWEFVVGEDDDQLARDEYADAKFKDADGPGIELPNAGKIRGKAELFQDRLDTGKSEGLGRSNGFFVKVRDRVVNLTDAEFGMPSELNLGTLVKFRMEVDADGLDGAISSPREGFKEETGVEELRKYLRAVFNRARTVQQKKESEPDADILAAKDRVGRPSAALSQRPLQRLLRRVAAGEEKMGGLLLDGGEDEKAAAETLLESDENLFQTVELEPLSDADRLVGYSAEKRAIVVNARHPFIANYLEADGAREPLRLVGATEFLTEVYMLDEDLDPDTVDRILRRRDEFLRALVSINPQSAAVVAQQLRDAKAKEDELEDAVADALSRLGFAVRRIGGRGKPDGLGTARLGPRTIDGGPTGYSVTYDAKSTGKTAIAAETAKTDALKKHRKDYSATYSLLVAPDFEGGNDEKSNLANFCKPTKEDPGITPIRVEDLARLVELSPFRAVSPETLRPLFESHLPKDSKAFVNALSEEPEPEATPVEAILDAIDRYSERKDAVSIETLNTALFDELGRDLGLKHLSGIVIGLKALAPTGLYWDGAAVALNKTKEMVIAEMKTTVSVLPADISTSYREILGVE